jgi:hypothetical protein
MQADDTKRADRPSYGDAPKTPTGIWVIAVLGLVGAAFSLLAGVGALAAGAVDLVVGGGLIVLGLAQAVTMLALVGLTPWAWYVTIALYTLGAIARIAQADGVGMVISLAVAAYVATHKDLFER